VPIQATNLAGPSESSAAGWTNSGTEPLVIGPAGTRRYGREGLLIRSSGFESQGVRTKALVIALTRAF